MTPAQQKTVEWLANGEVGKEMQFLPDRVRIENVMGMHERGELWPGKGPKRPISLLCEHIENQDKTIRDLVAKLGQAQERHLILNALNGLGPGPDAYELGKAGYVLSYAGPDGDEYAWNPQALAALDTGTLLRLYLDVHARINKT